MHRRNTQSGFTLVEILVALTILAGSLFVLLETHYSGLNARVLLREKALMQGMQAKAIGMAETDVLAGTLTGDGDFGKRFAEYTYDYEAAEIGETLPGLFEVVVRIHKGDDPEVNETRFFVYSSLVAMENFAAAGGALSPSGEELGGMNGAQGGMGQGRGQGGRGQGGRGRGGMGGFDRNSLPPNIRDRIPDNIDPAMIQRAQEMMRQRGGR